MWHDAIPLTLICGVIMSISNKVFADVLRLKIRFTPYEEIYTSGNSMLPIIEDNSLIKVVFPGQIGEGDIVLFYDKRSDSIVAHRIIKIINGFFITCGDNFFIPDLEVTREQMIGKVIESEKYNIVTNLQEDYMLYSAITMWVSKRIYALYYINIEYAAKKYLMYCFHFVVHRISIVIYKITFYLREKGAKKNEKVHK